MNYPVSTELQLRTVLRGLRKSRTLTQEQLGRMLGVNQKRTARIEKKPGVTSFDQISRIVSLLGGRLVIEVPDETESAPMIVSERSLPPRRTSKPSTIRDSW